MPRLVTAYRLSSLFATAWKRAYEAAHHFGGRARQYFPSALKEAWARSRTPAAAGVAMRQRVRASIASLAADIAACDAFMAHLYSKEEAARPVPATVLPFPSRRPVVPAAPARRAA